MNATLETIHSLHTNHGNFSERAVSEDDLATILTAALRAASSSARQPYSIVVLDDRDAMKRLVGYRASHALIFCVDYRRLELLAKRLDRVYDDDNVIGFVTACVDVSIAAQTAVIAARSLGVDSLITNGLHRNDMDTVYRELSLPPTSVFPLITVMLGYPTEEGHGPGGRLPVDALAHRGTYRDPSETELDAMAAAYDDPDGRLGLRGMWKPEEHGRYLEWFFDVWTGTPPTDRVPTGKVAEIQERLVASGFWWPEP